MRVNNEAFYFTLSLVVFTGMIVVGFTNSGRLQQTNFAMSMALYMVGLAGLLGIVSIMRMTTE